MDLQKIQNLEPALVEYSQLLGKESKTYRLVGIISLILGLALMPFLVYIGLAFLLASLWLFYMAYTLKKPGGYLYLGKVDSRSTKSKKEYHDAEKEASVREKFFVEIEANGAWNLEKKTPESIPNFGGFKKFKVNAKLYQLAETGKEMGFIVTPANDLIGYVLEGEIQFLYHESKFGGSDKKTVLSIDQDD